MIVAGDYKLSIFEGTEQYAKPHRLVTHPLYNRSTNNADIMLIKVLASLFAVFYVKNTSQVLHLVRKSMNLYLSVTRRIMRNQTMAVDFYFKSAGNTSSLRKASSDSPSSHI